MTRQPERSTPKEQPLRSKANLSKQSFVDTSESLALRGRAFVDSLGSPALKGRVFADTLGLRGYLGRLRS